MMKDKLEGQLELKCEKRERWTEEKISEFNQSESDRDKLKRALTFVCAQLLTNFN